VANDALLQRIRKRREGSVSAGGYRFGFSRPTDVDMLRYRTGNIDPVQISHDITRDFVNAWAKADGSPFVEDDLVGGGGSSPVPFERVLWHEWIAERSQLWAEIANAIVEAYSAHKGVLQDAGKGSPPTSTESS